MHTAPGAVCTDKTSLSQFGGIHGSEKRSPNALGRPSGDSCIPTRLIAKLSLN